MNHAQLKAAWKREEAQAHIHGWDFSHIRGRYEEEHDLPWDYEALARSCLRADAMLLDYDTGGGEFLLSLGHPGAQTAATEGYPPPTSPCVRKPSCPWASTSGPATTPPPFPFPVGPLTSSSTVTAPLTPPRPTAC